MKTAELRNKGKDELVELVISSKKELFNLRMQASTGQAAPGARAKEVKKTIARAKTLLNEQANGVKTSAPKKSAAPKAKAPKAAKKAKE